MKYVLKITSWFLTSLLVLLVSTQVQAATWSKVLSSNGAAITWSESSGSGSRALTYDALTSTCSISGVGSFGLSIQQAMGDVTELSYSSSVTCVAGTYIAVKLDSTNYRQVYINSGEIQSEESLWVMVDSSSDTIRWSRGSTTRTFTYNAPSINSALDNCPIFDGYGLAAEQLTEIKDLDFSASLSCDHGDRYLLAKLDDLSYWQIHIENNQINVSNLTGCDKSYSFTESGGCVEPTPTLTKFTDTIAAGEEDSAGITIVYSDLLANSDAALAKTSLNSNLGTELYFKISTVMSGGTLKIDDKDLLDEDLNITGNDIIGPGTKVVYKPGADINGETDAIQVSVINNLDHETLNGVIAKISLTPVNDAPRIMTNGSLFSGSGGNSPITSSTLRAVDDIDVEIGNEVTDDIVFRVVTPPSQGDFLRSGSAMSTGALFTQTDVNNGNISYQHTGSGKTDTISLTVQDGTGLSNDQRFPINISILSGDGGAPIITGVGANPEVTMSENSYPTPFLINLSATNPAGGDSLMIWRLGTQASNGIAEVFGLGRSPNDSIKEYINYIPNENFEGNDSFTVIVNNGTKNDSIITVNVTVENVNSAPVIAQGSNYEAVISEDSPFNETISATDIDNEPIIWDVSIHPLHGTVTITNNSSSSPDVRYIPDENYNGSDSFAITASDGSDYNQIKFQLYVTPQNDLPTLAEGNDISVTMSEDGFPTPFSLTLNAIDIEGDEISWSIKNQADNGTVSLSGSDNRRSISYTPQSNFIGTDKFTITVSDDDGSTDNLVTVTVQAQNDSPSITQGDAVSVTMSEEGSPTDFSLTLDAADIDSGTLTWSILAPASNGTASIISATGLSTSLTYAPVTDFFGSDSFVVQVSDGLLSDIITVNVTVEDVNDSPVIEEGNTLSKTVIEDTPLNIDITATDNDGNSLVWLIDQQPSNGSIEFLAGYSRPKRIKYTPDSDYFGIDSFIVGVSDGEYADQITVNLNITDSNDAPSFQEGTRTNITISEDSNPTAFKLTLHGLDNEGDDLVWSVDTPPSNGTANIIVPVTAGRAINYIPNRNFFGTDSFTIKIDDNNQSNIFRVNVTVDPQDDAPIIQNTIADITVELGESQTQIPLSTVFLDVDAAQSISKDVDSNDNEGLITTTINNDILTINYIENQVGTANIVLNGSSDGKTVQDHFSITVTDNTPPVFADIPLEPSTDESQTPTSPSTPSDTSLVELTYEAEGPLTPISPEAPSVTDITEVIVTSNAPEELPLGEHVIEWVAVDDSGNTSTATQTINIVDTTAPEIIFEKPVVTVSGNSIISNKVDLGIVQARDLINGYVLTTPNITLDGSTALFPMGQSKVIWQATDSSGNTVTKEQIVNVVDTTSPLITLEKPDFTVSASSKDTNNVDLGSVSAQDLVDGVITATTTTPLVGNTVTLSVGQHTITWQATDASGNTVSKTQLIDVVDSTPPVITLEKPTVVVYASSKTSNLVDLGTVTAQDAVDGPLVATTTISLDGSTANLALGEHSITWKAIDSSGNTSTITQVVQVNESDVPVILIANKTFEATGTTTDITTEMLAASATDLEDGVISPTAEIPFDGQLPIGEFSINWEAIDSDGNKVTATQLVTIEDTTPPALVIQNSDMSVNATAELTNISLSKLGISATDAVDSNVVITGKIDGEVLSGTLFQSGYYVIDWVAKDKYGNISDIKTQILQVTPLVNYGPTQIVSAGETVTVKLIMTGVAPSYPVTVAYKIDIDASEGISDIDHNAASGKLTLQDQETEAEFIFDVADYPVLDGFGQGKLVFSLDNLEGVTRGPNSTHTVDIRLDGVPPTVDGFSIQQGGRQVSAIVLDGGLATILLADVTNKLLFDWEMGNELVDLDSNEDTYTFDPSLLSLGSYNVVVTISDNNSSPTQVTSLAMNFNIVDALLEDVIDTDGDGIPDIRDIETSANMLPVKINELLHLFLVGEAGTKLKLGDTANLRGEYTPIVKLGENGLPVIPEAYASVLDTYNYKVEGVANGYATTTIIPQNTAIPDDAVYLIHDTEKNQWTTFVRDEDNTILSAPYEELSKNCPPADDDRYQAGLVSGYYCVAITMVDGGMYDVDNTANGIVDNLGVVAGRLPSSSNDDEATGSTSSERSGGGGSIPLESILLLIVAVFYYSKRLQNLIVRTEC